MDIDLKIIFLQFIKIKNAGNGVSYKSLEMFDRKFGISAFQREDTLDSLIEKEFIKEFPSSVYTLTDGGDNYLSKINLREVLGNLRNSRNASAIDFLLR